MPSLLRGPALRGPALVLWVSFPVQGLRLGLEVLGRSGGTCRDCTDQELGREVNRMIQLKSIMKLVH